MDSAALSQEFESSYQAAPAGKGFRKVLHKLLSEFVTLAAKVEVWQTKYDSFGIEHFEGTLKARDVVKRREREGEAQLFDPSHLLEDFYVEILPEHTFETQPANEPSEFRVARERKS